MEKPEFESQIYSALKGCILGDLRQAHLHLDAVEFKALLAEIKEVIEDYEKH